PQSDGVEPGRAEQRHLPGAVADQQAGQRAGAAMALFCGVAPGAALRGASLVPSQEGPRPRRGPARRGGRDAQAGRGAVLRGSPWRGVSTPAVLRPDSPAAGPRGPAAVGNPEAAEAAGRLTPGLLGTGA